MAHPNSLLAKWSPRVLSVLRIVAALLLMQHGAQKLFGVPAAPPPPPPPPQAAQQASQPPAQQQQQAAQQPQKLPPLLMVAGVLEFFGGLLLLLGLFTRAVAFILSGLMAAAYFMAHAPGGFWPVLNKGELAALFCFVFFYFIFAGGGAWSVDRCIWRRDGPERDTGI